LYARERGSVPHLELPAKVADRGGHAGGWVVDAGQGGGSGGCIVALAPHDKVEAVRKIIADNYEKQTGLKEDFYVCTASQGVSLC